jgi:hypothetical protein
VNNLRFSARLRAVCGASAACALVACGPRAHIPARGIHPVPGALAAADSAAWRARALAPILYLHPDETFPISRIVAVVHPTRPIIAYHLLWRDDVHGAWIPFTVPTDEEIVWVGHDSTGAPTDIWTYWHGRVLHTDWRGKGTPAVDVQWGKHGSLPHGTALGDLPASGTLNLFYAFTILGAPDIWLSNTMRKGPWCFCGSFRHYREFSRATPIAHRIDAIVRTSDPRETLRAVFGEKYSEKEAWP